MLLGWHYMYYYANSLCDESVSGTNRGYVVLAVNYRSGIGYGRAFREARGRAPAEQRNIKTSWRQENIWRRNPMWIANGSGFGEEATAAL